MTTTSGQPTLEEVAALAGVGRGTASRVINGSSQVSDRSRQAVMAAVAELGYVPNPAARSLVTRRTDTVALVISESEDRIFGEPFFAGVIRGISMTITASSRQLVLALAQTHDETSPLERYLSRQHVDGVLLLSLHGEDPLPRHIRERGLPMVLGGRPVGWDDGGYVDVDNRGGARMGVMHLVERGRRRIATIAGPDDMVAGRDRFDGYCAALQDARLEVDMALVARGDFSQASGSDAMASLLRQAPDIDGVFAANDLMAAGALRILRDAGRNVPHDVSVVGFDDAPMAALTEPPLTTVRQPAEQMGREMATLLIKQITAGAASSDFRILSTQLIKRDSS
ncbi:MAG TPA: LacI family DNA-binding transcriptional regulator [Nocardioidaceae bacterium]